MKLTKFIVLFIIIKALRQYERELLVLQNKTEITRVIQSTNSEFLLLDAKRIENGD